MASRPSSILVNVAVFIILEVASLCLLESDWSGHAPRFIGVASDIHGIFWSLADRIHEYASLKGENERLCRENTILMNREISFKQAQGQDSTIWVSDALPSGRLRFQTTPAKVVSMSRGSQHNYIILDRGRMDGVEKDDGVITATGAIGVVHSVGERFCYVLSLMNQDMAVSAKVGRDGFVGIMQWPGFRTGESVLENIPIHMETNPGDTVFTSGFSAIFPPDIPLGVMSDARTDDGSVASIAVKLFDDYARTYHVMIVKNLDKKQIRSLSE